MAVALESMHFYMQLNNCRVCKHVCARVCHGNCHRIHAFLCASEQLIGFVGISVTRFALSNVAESRHFYMQLKNCRVCKHVFAMVCHRNCSRIHVFLRAGEQL